MRKRVRAWAGICEGKPDTGWIEAEGYGDKLYGIFATRTEARKHYRRVVPCTITYSL